tara:strand:- start:7 stop:855 length:849 start_codon:yes stop_codon:yes gene_type:complete
MGWFDILKVDDIDFDKDLDAFGAYSLENKHSHPQQVMMAMMSAAMSGKNPELKDLVDEKIRINHQAIYRHLKKKLGREPKDKEIMEFVIRTIMHEGTHAGMGIEQFTMSPQATEYGAIVGQFPENTYYRLKTFLKHPDSQRQILHPMFDMMGIETTTRSEPVREVAEMIAFIDALTDNIQNARQQDKAKEKLARLEITARTQKKQQKLRQISPSSLEDLVGRYGPMNKRFFEKLLATMRFSNNNVEFDDTELKMAGAVTTASAPAMFNKVVRGRKKRRKKDE